MTKFFLKNKFNPISVRGLQTFLALTLTLSFCLLSCTSQTDSSSISTNQVVITNTPKDYPLGTPVKNEVDAQNAAYFWLKTGFYYSYIEPLTVVKVKNYSYEDYRKFIAEPLSPYLSADLDVWVVFYYNNEWRLIPPASDLTPYPAFHGCVYVAINSEDGTSLEVGGPVTKNIFPECDK
jgi:hypothetical protein